MNVQQMQLQQQPILQPPKVQGMNNNYHQTKNKSKKSRPNKSIEPPPKNKKNNSNSNNNNNNNLINVNINEHIMAPQHKEEIVDLPGLSQ